MNCGFERSWRIIPEKLFAGAGQRDRGKPERPDPGNGNVLITPSGVSLADVEPEANILLTWKGKS